MKFEFPNLSSERLFLRKFDYGDLNFVYNHFSNEAVCRFLLDSEPVKTLEEAEEILFWANDDSGAPNHHRWIVELKDGKYSIGTCGFHRWDRHNRIAEIGYDLSPEYRKNGYMTEALKTIVEFGFKNMDLNRIEAYVYTENGDSVRLLEKLGFMREGTVRDKHFFRGEFYDHICLSLLKSEYHPT